MCCIVTSRLPSTISTGTSSLTRTRDPDASGPLRSRRRLVPKVQLPVPLFILLQSHSMSSSTPTMLTHVARRLFLPLVLCFIVILAINLPKITTIPSVRQTWSPVQIQGRWKSVRASFGLPPLPDFVHLPAANIPSSSGAPAHAARFDLRRKRSIEEALERSKPPQLRFAADALRDQSVPLHRMAAFFRAVALSEKQITVEQTRARQKIHAGVQKGQRRP